MISIDVVLYKDKMIEDSKREQQPEKATIELSPFQRQITKE